jgi:hypothetical protein
MPPPSGLDDALEGIKLRRPTQVVPRQAVAGHERRRITRPARFHREGHVPPGDPANHVDNLAH